jgi:hypothetical protein
MPALTKPIDTQCAGMLIANMLEGWLKEQPASLVSPKFLFLYVQYLNDFERAASGMEVSFCCRNVAM